MKKASTVVAARQRNRAQSNGADFDTGQLLSALMAFKRGDFNPDDAVEFWDMVNKQDWHVCELSQQGISSRAYEPGPYSARESIPAAWDQYYLKMMR